MQEKECELLPVFTLEPYRAVVEDFPYYKERVVLRHCVHRYPRVSQDLWPGRSLLPTK